MDYGFPLAPARTVDTAMVAVWLPIVTQRPPTITRCIAWIATFAVWAAGCLVARAPMVAHEAESWVGPKPADAKVAFVCPDSLAQRIATPFPKNPLTPALAPSDRETSPLIVRLEARAQPPASPRLRRPLGTGIVVLRI